MDLVISVYDSIETSDRLGFVVSQFQGHQMPSSRPQGSVSPFFEAGGYIKNETHINGGGL